MRPEIERAVAILQRGGLVAFPTETVYGLGADALSAPAVLRIFAAKGRPADHPLIVHLPRAAEMLQWARRIPSSAARLAERFWPGPLTLVLARAPSVLDEVTGGQPTIGLRVPDHPVALELLNAWNGGLAAPSANRFGHISPTRAEHVRAELGTRVDMILDGGPCRVGLESTIVALTGPRPQILRPGAISAEELAEVLGEMPEVPEAPTVRAPGGLASHYSPRTPLDVVPAEALVDAVRSSRRNGRLLAVISRRSLPSELRGESDDRTSGHGGGANEVGPLVWWVAPRSAEPYARFLYQTLRDLDGRGCERILVEEVPGDADWRAAADRLRRASFRG